MSGVRDIDKYSIDEIERTRKSFMPLRVRVLYVGESVPNGGSFFYYANSNLYKRMLEVYKSRLKHEVAASDFLKYFMLDGNYLDDLCLEPVNQLDRKRRKEKHKQWVPSLADRIHRYDPECIVVVGKAIEPHVRTAVESRKCSNLRSLYCVPFPYPGKPPGHTIDTVTRFKNELGEILRGL